MINDMFQKSAKSTLQPPGPPATWEELAVSAEFSVSRLAKLCGVSTRTLQRRFKHQHGTNVSQWLKHVRLNEARTRLATAGAVKEVAYTLYYKQASHFSREFKQRFGVSPHTLLGPSMRLQFFPSPPASDVRQTAL